MTTDPTLVERLQRLADLLPRLEAKDSGAEFGQWAPSRQSEPGVWTMPYVEYGSLERAFREASIGWIRPDINWVAWASTDAAVAMRKEPDRLARATPEELAHLLTALVRGDRFNEGLLLDACKEGLLARIARRAAALAIEPMESKESVEQERGADPT
ncbi:MAG: DUF6508 domain-containing protein [Chloroflexota bacterium]